MASFSPQGQTEWGDYLAKASGRILGDFKFFKEAEDGNAINWVNKVRDILDYKDIPIGKVIANSSELSTALRHAGNDPNTIKSVINSAMVLHMNAVENSVLQTSAEMRADARREMQTGSISILKDELPRLYDANRQAADEMDAFINDHPRFNRATVFIADVLGAAPAGSRATKQDLSAFDEWRRLRTNLTKARGDLKRVSGKLDNYVDEIDEKDEMTKLNNVVGTTPPRAWAYIQNVGELVNNIENQLLLSSDNLARVEAIRQAEEGL
jgi:hypothetical protein